MSGVSTVTVRPEDGAGRLDRWFKRHYPGLGHGRLEKLLRTGQVRVDGKRARAGDPVAPGQSIRVPPLAEAPPAAGEPPRSRAPGRRMSRCCATPCCIATTGRSSLNKPAGLAVQGGTNTERHVDALLDALRFDVGRAAAPRAPARQGHLGRAADRAPRRRRRRFSPRAFREKTTRKIYWAVVAGLPRAGAGPHRSGARQRRRPGGGERVHADDEDGKSAVTYYRVIDHAGGRASWLALLPVTGRTHQLRAHCAALGTPILGDGKYGGAAAQLPGRRGGASPAPACAQPRNPAPGRRHVAGDRPVAAAYARASGIFSGLPPMRRDPFAEAGSRSA